MRPWNKKIGITGYQNNSSETTLGGGGDRPHPPPPYGSATVLHVVAVAVKLSAYSLFITFDTSLIIKNQSIRSNA